MYNSIIRYLDEHRLNEALSQLNAFAKKLGHEIVLQRVEELQENYKYLLQYAGKNTPDPNRKIFLRQIWDKTYYLTDYLNFSQKLKDGYGQQADLYRTFQLKPTRSYKELGEALSMFNKQNYDSATDEKDSDPGSMQEEGAYFELVDELFNKTWCSNHWTAQDYKEAIALPFSGTRDFETEVFISATTLNLLNYYDQRKFHFLLNTFFELGEKKVKARVKALVGIILTVYYHENRIGDSDDAYNSYRFFKSDEDFPRILDFIQTMLLKTRETEKINKKIHEEFFSKIMKNSQLNMKNIKDISELDIKDLEEFNPSWQNDINEIASELQKFDELQRTGADINMGTFSSLKSYPFFNKAAHWFYPFNKNIPDIAELFQNEENKSNPIIKSVVNSVSYCNSDKYSFCLAIKDMSFFKQFTDPENNIDQTALSEFTASQFGGDTKRAEWEELKWAINQYIQDLYRFFKLWRYRNQQHDIFADRLTLNKCQTFFKDTLVVGFDREVANYLFSNGYYDEAEELYEKLLKLNCNDVEINQKLGFIYQKNKQFDEAIQRYEKADFFAPGDTWTLKHLVQCFKHFKNYDKAIELLDHLEKIQPGNIQYPLQKGYCLISIQKYKEALENFSKAEYLGKDSIPARRGMGWCYFMLNDFEKAIETYETLKKLTEFEMEDWINLGHVYMAISRMDKAIHPYLSGAKCCESFDEFIIAVEKDKPVLLEKGISEEDIHIACDIVWASL